METSVLELTAHIVAAYVEKNPLPQASLPDLISSVSASVGKLSGPIMPVAEPLVPKVSPKKSVRPDQIICLECGKSFKSIKRHIGNSHGLTPVEYRARWSLDKEYPMTAPDYSLSRSRLAKSIGLGRKLAATETRAPAKITKKTAKEASKISRRRRADW